MRLFSYIFGRLFKKPAPPRSVRIPIAFCQNAPDWTDVDVENMSKFLGTVTGQKMLSRGMGLYALKATEACGEVWHTEKNAMRAAGFGDCLKWVRSLGSKEMLSQAASAPAAPVGVTDEKNSITRQEDEAELIGKLSP